MRYTALADGDGQVGQVQVAGGCRCQLCGRVLHSIAAEQARFEWHRQRAKERVLHMSAALAIDLVFDDLQNDSLLYFCTCPECAA